MTPHDSPNPPRRRRPYQPPPTTTPGHTTGPDFAQARTPVGDAALMTGLSLEALNDGSRRGLRLSFEDQGPGIADVETALRDGYTTGSGLGLGLGGAKRLSNEFEIHSRPGEGTRVVITRWR